MEVGGDGEPPWLLEICGPVAGMEVGAALGARPGRFLLKWSFRLFG